MKGTYNTEHFIWGESEPTTQPQKTLSDIVIMVKERLAEALCDPSCELQEEHPRIVISMVITNIFVNLLFNTITAEDVSRRMSMVTETLDEIRDMTHELWTALETARADKSTAH